MPGLSETLAALGQQKADALGDVREAWVRYVDAVAHLEAIEAREAAVRGRRSIPTDLSGLSQRDAILAVLREADRAAGPTEVWEQLKERGFENVEVNAVGVQISRLLEQGEVERTGRGRYLAH